MRRYLVLTLWCLGSVSAWAHGSHEAHGQGTLAAHEHGQLTVNAALVGSVLEVELEGPAASITGFEYAPTREEDQKTALSARQKLESPASLFGIAADAQCRLLDKTVDGLVFGNSGEHEHEHEHEHEDAKAEAHGEASHRHSDVEAHYRFECVTPGALSYFDMSGLFEAFPLTHKVNVQYVGERGQKGVTLTSGSSRFSMVD